MKEYHVSQLLEHLTLLIGAVTAVGFVAAMWGSFALLALSDILNDIARIRTIRQDKKYFTQIEEFHRDFAA